VGITGPDKGEGGKYLFLPPGYKGEIPSGYNVVKSPTFNIWIPWRSFLVKGDPKPGVELVTKNTKIYPLSSANNPPALNFVNMSGKPFNTVAPADYRFWELLNQVVQEEPSESLDQIRLGYYASIGIQKGKPFKPDERMKKILTEAAAVGDATARTIAFHNRQKEAYYYPNSAWQLPFIGGYKFQTQPDVLNMDAYIYYYFMATGVTPAMEEKMVGLGSQYACLMVTRVIASIYRPIFPLKIFGQLFFTATKRDRRFRRIKGFLVSVVRLRGFWLMLMVLWISISGRNRLLVRGIIGCRRFLARVGIRFFGFMARLSLGLTRLGDQGRSSY